MRLRRPVADDLDDVFRIHDDPCTNRHNPAGPDRDTDASRARLEEWLAHWDRHGFGYWVVEDDGGAVIAYTTEDNVGSQRTAAAAGLVRRRDLESEVEGRWAVVYSLPENRSPSGGGAS